MTSLFQMSSQESENSARRFDRVEFSLDHDTALGIGEYTHSAATAFVPDGPARAITVCFPGGGYSRRYYDFDTSDHHGYSMAGNLAERGLLVVTVDPLGVGDSSHPLDPQRITPEMMALANSVATKAIVGRSRAGSLVDGLDPVRGPAFGIGHSAGGGLLVIQQALYADFDAIIAMGFSAVRMPTSTEMTRLDPTLEFPTTALSGELLPQRYAGYARTTRGPAQHHWYHWDDVPADVIAADDAAAVEYPPCLGLMNAPGYVGRYGPQISCPVRLLWGERDLRLAQSDERSAYPDATDIDCFILMSSGHCHNFASTRTLGWDRVAAWCSDLITDLPNRKAVE